MKEVAIVGAGVSGLAAALILGGERTLVVEKSRGVGGRAATREVGGLLFDHGANYFTLEDGDLRRLILDQGEVARPVSFHGEIRLIREDKIELGDPRRAFREKWTYTEGIRCLGRSLLQRSGVETIFRSEVSELRPLAKGGWILLDDDGQVLAEAKRVLVTAPAEQAASWLPEVWWRKGLSECSYHRQFSVMLAFDQAVERRDPFYAALSVDADHPLAWLSFEDDKPGRIPADRSGVVVQMAPAWSAQHFDQPREWIAEQALTALEQLLDVKLPKLTACDVQRWKFAHPIAALDSSWRDAAERDGIYLAGDALLGKGRVEGALLSGLEVGRRLLALSGEV